jgi:hypothetical protein
VRVDNVRIALNRVSARTVAVGQMRGTPRGALLARKGANLDEVADRITEALTRAGGADPYIGEGSAFVITALRKDP